MKGVIICRIGYVEESLRAMERVKLGDKQYKHKECGLYHWKGETCGLKPGVTTGKAIRLVRTLRDMPQKLLAKRCRISASYLSLIEGDCRQPTLKLLRKIALELLVQPSVLVR